MKKIILFLSLLFITTAFFGFVFPSVVKATICCDGSDPWINLMDHICETCPAQCGAGIEMYPNSGTACIHPMTNLPGWCNAGSCSLTPPLFCEISIEMKNEFMCSGRGILQKKVEKKQSPGECLPGGLCKNTVGPYICGEDSDCPLYCEEVITWPEVSSCSSLNTPTGLSKCSSNVPSDQNQTGFCDPTKCDGVGILNPETNEYSPKSDCCGVRNIWLDRDACGGCKATERSMCINNDIYRVMAGENCAVVDGNAQCQTATCAPTLVTDCGVAQKSTIPMCSGGLQCTITIDFPGTCLSMGGNSGGCTAPSISTVCNGSCVTPPVQPPPQPETHNECRGSTGTGFACVMLWGAGTNECETGEDCLGTHSECYWDPQYQLKCSSSVGGFGANQCTSDASCSNGMHSECDVSDPNNPLCVAVSGTGSNTCNSAFDCVYGFNKCNNLNQCVLVNGVGQNQCTIGGNECAGGQHNECVAYTDTFNTYGLGFLAYKCEVKPGPGGDECVKEKECRTFSHTECDSNNGQCVVKAGLGKNQCDKNNGNLDCSPMKYSRCSNQKCVVTTTSTGTDCAVDTDCTTVTAITKCNTSTCQCTTTGTGASCDTSISNDCIINKGCSVTKCNNSCQCTTAGTGASCTTATDCTAGGCVPTKCTISHACSLLGTGPICALGSECLAYNHCNTTTLQCTSTGTGDHCLTNSDCTATKCNTSTCQCTTAGTGASCNAGISNDCIGNKGCVPTTKCNTSTCQCTTAGTGASCNVGISNDCTANKGCVPTKCNTSTCQCTTTGTGASCTTATDCTAGGCVPAKCDTSTCQCTTTGTGASCDANISNDCTANKGCVKKYSTCNFGLGKCEQLPCPGGVCPANQCNTDSQCKAHCLGQACVLDFSPIGFACNAFSDCVSKCTTSCTCSFYGTGSVCANNQDCTSASCPRCENSTCSATGTGKLCSTDADCPPPVTKTYCDAECKCSLSGTGLSCLLSSTCDPLVCATTRCSGYMCSTTGTGKLCDKTADCLPTFCDTSTCQCTTTGTGASCDTSISNDCIINKGCDDPLVHNECNSACQCVEKPGRAIDQCALGSNCTQPICLKRNVCDANKRCVAIDCLQGGTTGDDCNVDSDCTDTAYHGECAKVGEACKCNQVLGGNIESQCSADADCSTSPVCMKKNVCVGQSCVSQNCLSSEGCTSNCTATSQCCLAGNHTECNYESKQCVCVPGVDVNECDTNGECIQRKECKSAFIGIYGGNWEVSDTCVSLDNAEGGAPCVNTTQCLLNFTAPYVNNLVIGTAPYCTGISEIGTVPISWQYNHTEDKSQKQFTIQIDDNSDFSSPEVNMSWLTSYSNSQLIQVRNTPTISGTYNSGDYITYNVDYYVRVRVQDQDGVYSLWTYYDSTNNGTTDEGAKTIYKFPYAHPAPSIDFDYAPIKIMPSDPVVFTNRSFCYGGNCTSILWNFGDGSTDAETWSPTHTYDEKGDYIVGLKVCDNSGVSIECCFATPKVVPVDIQTGQDLPIFKEVSPQ